MSRIYVNVKRDFVIRVLDRIALAPPADVGMEAFKVAGPEAIESRRDRLVIYFKTEQAAMAYYNAEMKNFNPIWFHPEVPHMTKKLSTGISYGAEPDQKIAFKYLGENKSFGRIRANALAFAFDDYYDVLYARENAAAHRVGTSEYNKWMTFVPEMCRLPCTESQMLEKFVWYEFKRLGLDAANPERNL